MRIALLRIMERRVQEWACHVDRLIEARCDLLFSTLAAFRYTLSRDPVQVKYFKLTVIDPVVLVFVYVIFCIGTKRGLIGVWTRSTKQKLVIQFIDFHHS